MEKTRIIFYVLVVISFILFLICPGFVDTVDGDGTKHYIIGLGVLIWQIFNIPVGIGAFVLNPTSPYNIGIFVVIGHLLILASPIILFTRLSRNRIYIIIYSILLLMSINAFIVTLYISKYKSKFGIYFWLVSAVILFYLLLFTKSESIKNIFKARNVFFFTAVISYIIFLFTSSFGSTYFNGNASYGNSLATILYYLQRPRVENALFVSKPIFLINMYIFLYIGNLLIFFSPIILFTKLSKKIILKKLYAVMLFISIICCIISMATAVHEVKYGVYLWLLSAIILLFLVVLNIYKKTASVKK